MNYCPECGTKLEEKEGLTIQANLVMQEELAKLPVAAAVRDGLIRGSLSELHKAIIQLVLKTTSAERKWRNK